MNNVRNKRLQKELEYFEYIASDSMYGWSLVKNPFLCRTYEFVKPIPGSSENYRVVAYLGRNGGLKCIELYHGKTCVRETYKLFARLLTMLRKPEQTGYFLSEWS